MYLLWLHPLLLLRFIVMNDVTLLVGGILLVGLLILGFILYKKFFKRPVVPCVYCITGAPKTGKSNLSVTIAVSSYRKNTRQWYIKMLIKKVIKFITFKRINVYKGLEDEKPMLYSNMPLAGIKYNPFTMDILMRKVRVPFKSVILIDEVSLLADSMMYKDQEINDALTCFIKLIGHENHSSSATLIYNTQDMGDCHFSFKRCSGRYLYLYASRHIPFFNIYEGIELINSDANQGGVNNVISGDVQKNIYRMIYSSKYYRMYDAYYLSSATDGLPKSVNYDVDVLNKRRDSLKCKNLVSLHKWKLFHKDEKEIDA